MNKSLRRSLLQSAAVSALLATGSHGAVAQSGASVTGGGSTLAYRDYEKEFSDDTLYSKAGEDFTYCSVGSGAGTSAFVSNTVTPLNADPSCNGVVTTPVDYGASDAVISATNVTFFKTTYNQPLIQLPMFGTPIAIPFHLGSKTDGGETLSDSQLCGIFSGAITDWHKIDSTIASGTTIKVAYRGDSSGTSFLFTNHLKSVCPATTSSSPPTGFTSAQLAAMPTNTFGTSLFGGTLPPLPSNFTAETGSSGVEGYITGTSNSIGYLSPDYTDIAPRNSTGGFPAVVKVTNSTNSVSYLPNVTNTSTALGTISAPTGTNVSNPTLWSPLIPTPAAGYPIVGWTQWFVATCYNHTANSGVSSDLINFLTDHFNISGTAHTMVTDITNNGFVPVSGETVSSAATGFALAIKNNFLTNSSGNNLNISDTGTSASDPTCKTGVTGR